MPYNPVGTKNFMGIQELLLQEAAQELQKKQLEQQAEQAKIGQILQGIGIATGFASPLISAGIAGAQAAALQKTAGEQALDQIAARGSQEVALKQTPEFLDESRKRLMEFSLDKGEQLLPYEVEGAGLTNTMLRAQANNAQAVSDAELQDLLIGNRIGRSNASFLEDSAPYRLGGLRLGNERQAWQNQIFATEAANQQDMIDATLEQMAAGTDRMTTMTPIEAARMKAETEGMSFLQGLDSKFLEREREASLQRLMDSSEETIPVDSPLGTSLANVLGNQNPTISDDEELVRTLEGLIAVNPSLRSTLGDPLEQAKQRLRFSQKQPSLLQQPQWLINKLFYDRYGNYIGP